MLDEKKAEMRTVLSRAPGTGLPSSVQVRMRTRDSYTSTTRMYLTLRVSRSRQICFALGSMGLLKTNGLRRCALEHSALRWCAGHKNQNQYRLSTFTGKALR